MAAARIPLALIVIGAGVFAALHVGKLASALATLQQALGMSLLQAGFLRSLVQLAGMALRLALGALADGLGGRRSMLLGIVTLGGASTAGGLSQGVAPMMALRVVEGFGFLLVVLPVPGLLRTLVPPERLSAALGLWAPTRRWPPRWRCWAAAVHPGLRMAHGGGDWARCRC